MHRELPDIFHSWGTVVVKDLTICDGDVCRSTVHFRGDVRTAIGMIYFSDLDKAYIYLALWGVRFEISSVTK